MQAGERTGTALSITRTIVGTLAVMLAIAACTDSPSDPPTATATTTTATEPTPTPTPSPTIDLTVPPVRPDAMSTPDADGAAAAAAYFTQLYAYAYATADLTEWKAMSEPDCQFCTNVINGVTAMVSDGESDTSAPIDVTFQSGTEIIPDASFSASLEMHQGESSRLDGEGRTLRTAPAGNFELQFAIAWRDGWFIREVDTKPVDATPAS
jgi:hypothetical protein